MTDDAQDTSRPKDEDDVQDAVNAALANGGTLDIIGQGTKRGLGRPMEATHTLSLAGLSGITLYQPEELVLTAKAGTPLADIEAALAERGQQLAFEPPDWGPLYGFEPGQGTIGGVIAANMAGPRRIRSGAARDHLLGARFVTGRGEINQTGGRVVKNVTGYDLCKLLAGSFGTLGVLTELTVKVLPAPEKTRTILVMGANAAQAGDAMTQALAGPHDVSGAAYLPADIAARSTVGHVASAAASVTAIRIEGPEPSVAARCDSVRKLLLGFGEIEELHFHNSRKFWKEVADVAPFAKDQHTALWRLSVPPAEGAALSNALHQETGAAVYLDWGGGLIWAAIENPDIGEPAIRAAIGKTGGHATLFRASHEQRGRIPVFQPQPAPLAALAERVRLGFDPENILNPGRLCRPSNTGSN
jgi:glycolate oxidase FAD binding subunit